MIISARLVVIVLLASIVAITTISTQTFTNTASAVATNTNNTSSSSPTMNIRPNIQTDFNPNATYPRISKFAYVAPFAVCRGDEGIPIRIGDYSNMQDGVILHALETTSHSKNMDNRRYSAEGSLLKGNDAGFKNGFAIYVGDKVSLAHGVQVHGRAYIGNDTFVGMKSFVF